MLIKLHLLCFCKPQLEIRLRFSQLPNQINFKLRYALLIAEDVEKYESRYMLIQLIIAVATG